MAAKDRADLSAELAQKTYPPTTPATVSPAMANATTTSTKVIPDRLCCGGRLTLCSDRIMFTGFCRLQGLATQPYGSDFTC